MGCGIWRLAQLCRDSRHSCAVCEASGKQRKSERDGGVDATLWRVLLDAGEGFGGREGEVIGLEDGKIYERRSIGAGKVQGVAAQKRCEKEEQKVRRRRRSVGENLQGEMNRGERDKDRWIGGRKIGAKDIRGERMKEKKS